MSGGWEYAGAACLSEVQAVYASPMIRCTQTAGILFPGKKLNIIDELAECDFGEFENKNYQELDGNEHYQSWIDSGGLLPFCTCQS